MTNTHSVYHRAEGHSVEDVPPNTLSCHGRWKTFRESRAAYIAVVSGYAVVTIGAMGALYIWVIIAGWRGVQSASWGITVWCDAIE